MTLKAALAAALLLVTAGGAWASTLSVTPIRLTLSPAQPLGTFTVLNEGNTPARAQLFLNDWKQENGADVLTPSRDVLLNPTVFEIPANGRQIVRLGLRVPAAPSERSYRLLLREIPTPDQLKANAIGVLLQISVPLFVPVDGATAELSWRAKPAPKGLDFQIDNKGRRHTQITELTVSRAGKTIGKMSGSTYVLPNATGHLLVPMTAQAVPGETLQLSAKTDNGSLQASVRVDGK